MHISSTYIVLQDLVYDEQFFLPTLAYVMQSCLSKLQVRHPDSADAAAMHAGQGPHIFPESENFHALCSDH